MKKILFLGHNVYYKIYKCVFDKICLDYNINAELLFGEYEEKISNEYFLNYDGIYLYKSFICEVKEKEKHSNYYFKNETDTFKAIDLKIRALKKLFDFKKFKIEGSNILILETNEYFNSLYELCSINKAKKINIASIKQNNPIKLNHGDYFSNYLDIEKFKDIDLLVNLTNIGDIFSIDACPISLKSNISSKYVLDTNIFPIETVFLKKFKILGSEVMQGIYLLIFELAYLIEFTFNLKNILNESYIDEILSLIKDKIEFNEKMDVFYETQEFKELMKGEN